MAEARATQYSIDIKQGRVRKLTCEMDVSVIFYLYLW